LQLGVVVMITREQQKEIIRRYRDGKDGVRGIILYVNECILEPYNRATGENYFITQQQIEGLNAIYDLVHAKLKGEKQDILGVSVMSGKGCHAKGTSVMMHYGGCRRVEDIQVGDWLMGDDGLPRMVLSLKQGREQMYRVSLSDGSWYDVNESHILSLRCCETGQRGSLKWGNIVNVPVKEYLTWSNRKKKSYCAYKVPVDFEKQNVKIPPYILGCWVGDGDSDSARLVNEDKEVIKAWKEYGESLGLKYRCYNKIDHRIVGDGKSNKFMNLLREYNLVNNKHIPSAYILNDRKTRMEFLAGLIDTDGCVRKKGAYSISTKYKDLAESILFLARSLGFRGTLKKSERIRGQFKKKLQIEYIINISRGNTEEIPVRIKYKKAVQSQQKDLNFTFKIEKLKIDDYYGFELDGNHLYVLGDFSVTHNTGKDAMTVWAVKWFMFCFPKPKIPCVSVSDDQLDKVLWSEMAKWSLHATDKQYFTLQSDKFFRIDLKPETRGKIWFAFKKAANPKSSPEEQVETLQGLHEDYLFQIVDEGSGVLTPVYSALENNQTGKCNLMLVIFNPMHARGYAIDTQYANSHRWIALRWNAEESEITNKSNIRRIKEDFGVESNPYRMNVLGLPPLFDEKTLINFEWITEAVNRPLEVLPGMPKIKSLDCGAGGDMSIIATRIGNKILPFKKNKSDDSAFVEGWVGNDIDNDPPDSVWVDTIGIGWAVEGGLRDKKGSIIGSADTRRLSDEPERFTNKRAEMYWRLRELFEKGTISIPNDPDLIEQLSVIKYEPDKKGRTLIMEKKKIKKEIGHSPDEADALALLYYYPDKMVSRKKRVITITQRSNTTWMAA